MDLDQAATKMSLNTYDASVLDVLVPKTVLDYFSLFEDDDLWQVLVDATYAYFKDLVKLSYCESFCESYGSCVSLETDWGRRLIIFIAGANHTDLLRESGSGVSDESLAYRLCKFLRAAVADYIKEKYGSVLDGILSRIQVQVPTNSFFVL